MVNSKNVVESTTTPVLKGHGGSRGNSSSF